MANGIADENGWFGEEGWVILKIDFEKTYDHVDWGLLDYVLLRFGTRWMFG